MRVAITGAGGFIGRHLVPRILREGYSVAALVHRSRPAGWPQEVAVHQGEVTDQGFLVGTLGGCDAVVHLAAILRQDGGSFKGINVGGTRTVVAACKEANVSRLIHVSAQGARTAASTGFLRSKGAAEEVVRSSGLRWTILRPSLVLGREAGFAVRLAQALRRGRRVPIVGPGRNLVQPVHVEDLGDLVCLCLREGKGEGRILEVGGPGRIPLSDLSLRFARALGHQGPPIHIPRSVALLAAGVMAWATPRAPVTPGEVAMMTMENVCNNSQLEAIGFRPARDLEAMLADSLHGLDLG